MSISLCWVRDTSHTAYSAVGTGCFTTGRRCVMTFHCIGTHWGQRVEIKELPLWISVVTGPENWESPLRRLSFPQVTLQPLLFMCHVRWVCSEKRIVNNMSLGHLSPRCRHRAYLLYDTTRSFSLMDHCVCVTVSEWNIGVWVSAFDAKHSNPQATLFTSLVRNDFCLNQIWELFSCWTCF